MPKINKDKDFLAKSTAQKQLIYADLNAVNEVLLTGPGGTGKTVSLIISSMGPCKDGRLLVDNSNYVGLILRRESTQLERSGLIRTATEWYKKFYPDVEYNGSLKRFTFPSGSQIVFGGCESEDDALKYKGFSRLHFLGLEEGTQFTQRQIDILTTRLRDADTSIPLRIRISTNAGENEEPLLNRYKYWLYQSCVHDLDPPIKCRYGDILFRFIDENDANLPIIITDKKPQVPHETFMCIETKVNDIMSNNIQTLGKITDLVLREQLLNHKWGLKPSSGMYFKEEYFKEASSRPSQCTRIRYWDKAASKRGDYTCGLLLSRNHNDTFVVEDCIITKVEAPELKPLILNTARADGKTVHIAIEQEGGSSGKEIAFEYEKMLSREGFNVLIDQKSSNRETSSKLSRAAIISPLVKEGRFALLAGNHGWRKEFMNQLVNFPSRGVHDDVVDCLSGAYLMLMNKLPGPLASEKFGRILTHFNNTFSGGPDDFKRGGWL